ncbi:MAG: PilN domain-containing protein [Pyrinomonadaceae bacterium]
MIRINLLESVTDRPSAVSVVEDKVASPLTQTLLLALVVGALLIMAMGYDYVSSRSQNAFAKKELEKQERINQQMNAVNKERSELEKKIKDIQVRIDAIQRLRASQQGPGFVLKEIKDRFDSVPGLYLKSVEQKETELTIKGESPNEASVTRFGQSLEFSSGLFTNLNIETLREVVQVKTGGASSAATEDPNAPKPEVVTFTIKCNYSQPSNSQPANPAPNPANHIAKN